MSNKDDNYIARLHEDHPDCPFVSKSNYANNKKTNKWLIGVFFGFLSIFFALVVYAADQAHNANGQYIEMTTGMSEHKAEIRTVVRDIQSKFEMDKLEQRAFEKSMNEKLDGIRVEAIERRKEQKVLMEKILTLQIELARRSASSK